MRQFLFPIPYIAPEHAYAVFADKAFSLFFDSSDQAHQHSNKCNQYSFIAFDPVETISVRNDRTEIRNKEYRLKLRGNPFKHLRRRLSEWSDNIELLKKPPVPFTGGAAGYFGYDLARSLEHLPTCAEDDMALPNMAIGIYHQVLAFDLLQKKCWHIVTAADKHMAESLHHIVTAKIDNMRSAASAPEAKCYSVQNWTRARSQNAYQDNIQSVIDYIHAGDIFQANLAQRFQADLPDNFSAYSYYLHLRQVNPAPFSSYMNFGSFQILSCSPERFLKVENRFVETRPIKGTLDSAYPVEQLKNSDKDRAENIMIVDLLRNDLSKTCETNSIQVPSLCAIESYAGLHHMVSSVTGTLKPHKTSMDVLENCFPGGSITGAPKIRAMEIIESLEPTRRGPYCGSIGYIDFNDTMDTNIVIRTIVIKNKTATFHVGSGIVADSDAHTEYLETMLKARKIFESFESQSNTTHNNKLEKQENAA